MISPWLFNIYINGVVKGINPRMLGRDLSLVYVDDIEWKVKGTVYGGYYFGGGEFGYVSK